LPPHCVIIVIIILITSEIVTVSGSEADLEFQTELSASEAVQQQVDAVVDVEQTEADCLDQDVDLCR